MKINLKINKKVAIVIITYSQEKLLLNFLKSLKKINYPDYKIYFVDDSGKGNIGKRIIKEFPEVNTTINEENLGCSKSYNLGMKKAIKEYSPDYLFLLNDDMKLVDINFINKMVNVGEGDKDIGILGCRIIHPDGSLQWGARYNKLESSLKSGKLFGKEGIEENQEVQEIIGCCFLIKKKVINKIGFWDEEFSPAYGEESDYSFRAKNVGFKLMYVGDAEIIHYGSSTTNKLESDWIWFLRKRNSIRLEWKHYSFSKKVYYSIVHFGSIFKRNGISLFKKLNLLKKAYFYNLKNLREIKEFRKSQKIVGVKTNLNLKRGKDEKIN